ncbi:HlyD family efflux transporter periplasmic adaptor subunit [Streptomyces sp. NPDC088725]|uniref:HlyD family efflux transporter periplasmic adaptor subunit n=1 Tax=Streptomyces sp. NPDC088725 TaxID=3365873 RepID=UPI00382D2C74
MKFRQQALSKLQSSDEIDLPVRLVRPQGLLVLSVTVLVVLAAFLWAVTGSVTPTLNTSGVLTHGQGSYVLQSPVAGQVTEVVAKEGQMVAAEAPVVKVRTAKGSEVVKSVAAGRLTTLATAIGAVVAPGTEVASLELVDRADAPLKAVLYLSSQSAATVSRGDRVDLTVQSVSPGEHGLLSGRVETVGQTTETRLGIAGFLGSAQLADRFSREGQPVAVMVLLDRSKHTASGYVWSSPDGPRHAPESMTLISATIHLAEQRPIDWLLS